MMNSIHHQPPPNSSNGNNGNFPLLLADMRGGSSHHHHGGGAGAGGGGPPAAEEEGAAGGVDRLLRVLRHNMLPIQNRSSTVNNAGTGRSSGGGGDNNAAAAPSGEREPSLPYYCSNSHQQQNQQSQGDVMMKPGGGNGSFGGLGQSMMSLLEPLPVQQSSSRGGGVSQVGLLGDLVDPLVNVLNNGNNEDWPLLQQQQQQRVVAPRHAAENNDCFARRQLEMDRALMQAHTQQQQQQQQQGGSPEGDDRLFKMLSTSLAMDHLNQANHQNQGYNKQQQQPQQGHYQGNVLGFGGGVGQGQGQGTINFGAVDDAMTSGMMNNNGSSNGGGGAMRHANAVSNLMSNSLAANLAQQQQQPLRVHNKNGGGGGSPGPALHKNVSSPSPQQHPPVRFKPFHEEKWSQRLDELRHFARTHGNTLVPHTYPPNPQLARWVKRQRRQYKLMTEGKVSTMTPARVALLEDAGFVWDSHEASWREKIAELKEYRRKHGNCLVPSSYKSNPSLAVWVKCQRRQYKLWGEGKASAMTTERINELEAQGFCWEVRAIPLGFGAGAMGGMSGGGGQRIINAVPRISIGEEEEEEQTQQGGGMGGNGGGGMLEWGMSPGRLNQCAI